MAKPNPKLKLYFYSGAGNKFVFIDLRKKDQKDAFTNIFKKIKRYEVALKLCRKYRAYGIDGAVLLENHKQYDLLWDFYNADGSKAEMCGNAARCAGLHIWQTTHKKQTVMLKTLAGVITLKVHGASKIFVTMRPLKSKKFYLHLKSKGMTVHYDFIDFGVPHAVVLLPNWNLGPRAKKIAAFLKNHPAFKPKSTNVTYWQPNGEARIRAATFERGVKGYTQACGTGAVAAAYSFYHRYEPLKKIIKVEMPGGTLSVNLKKSRPILSGPTKRFATTYL
jgi:diaminopimelate epimerase